MPVVSRVAPPPKLGRSSRGAEQYLPSGYTRSEVSMESGPGDVVAAYPSLDRVPVGPFRIRFVQLERRGVMSRTELARVLGWSRRPPASMRRRGHVHAIPDTGRVSAVLGMKAGSAKRTIAYDTAVRLCRALDMDPVDCGI